MKIAAIGLRADPGKPGCRASSDRGAVAYLPHGEALGMVHVEDPVTRSEVTASIAGGFVLLPVAALMEAWRVYQSNRLGIGAFRAWLACWEMIERRKAGISTGRKSGPANYTFAELAKLTGVSEKRARASLLRLVRAGLVEWSERAIAFPETVDRDARIGNVPRPTTAAGDSIGGGRGRLAIPRRMLRHLARGGRPALIATVLGVLLRCLSRRKAGWTSRGRLKASWVARTFGVEARRVKQARAELIASGWIQPEPSDQWAWNCWGAAYRIDLAWSPSEHDDSRLAPPPGQAGPKLAPPCLDQEPLREESQDQEPAGRRSAGVEVRGEEEKDKFPPPTLDDVRPEDLKDTGRLLDLHRQAVERGLVDPSEVDRLHVVAAAEHALTIGKANPPGLFAYLVRGRCWRYLTDGDEDRANARLKAHRRGPDLSRFAASVPRRPGISEDARMVREIREATIRAGIFRDPFPTVQARDKTWTRERWDAALAELGLVG